MRTVCLTLCFCVLVLVAEPALGQDATVYVEDSSGATSASWGDGSSNTLYFLIAADPAIELWGYQINGPCSVDPVTYIPSTVSIDATRPDFLFADCVYSGCPLFTSMDQGNCAVGNPPRMAAITGPPGDPIHATTVGPDEKLCGCPVGDTCMQYSEGGPCTTHADCVSALDPSYDGACFHLEYAGQMDYACFWIGRATIAAHPTDGFLEKPDGSYYSYAVAGFEATCPDCADSSVCDDADPCTQDLCINDLCDHSTPTVCDDGDPCTDDDCDPTEGCTFAPTTGPCDDGNACTEDDTCFDETCSGTAIVCDDGDLCTANTCDPGIGCVYPPDGAPYGDVTDLGGDCPADPDDHSGCEALVGLPDLVYVLQAFGMGAEWPSCFPNADLASALTDPCTLDGNIALPDISAVLQAFGQVYQCEPPCPCAD